MTSTGSDQYSAENVQHNVANVLSDDWILSYFDNPVFLTLKSKCYRS